MDKRDNKYVIEMESLSSKGSTCCRRFGIVLALLLLLGCVAVVIYLAVEVSNLKSRNEERQDSTKEKVVGDDTGKTECDGIAIIGAGIAGTYAGWKLRDTNQTITIYEYSNRVGGRLHSTKIAGVPDFDADLGAMRFRPNRHPRITKTIEDLGLKILDFEHIGYGKIDTTLLYLRGSHMRYKDIVQNKGMLYKLRPEEMVGYDQLRWEAYINNTDRRANEASSDYHVKTLDGIQVYKQSMQSALFKSISTEAESYIREVDGWYAEFREYSAMINYPQSDPATNSGQPLIVKTVENGFMAIPKALLKEFLEASSKHKLTTNRQLTAIMKQPDSTYLLKFMSTVTVDGITAPINVERNHCAKKVILAINRLPLETLDWSGLRQPHIRDIILNAVKDIPAAKIYFAYAKPWWRDAVSDFQFAVSDTPLRQTYDFGTMKESNVSILNVGYMDNDVSIWDEMRQRGYPINGAEDSTMVVTDEMVSMVNRFLAEIFNVTVNDIPQPLGAVMGIWNSFPFGGAWQNFMPGYVWTDVEQQMVQPSADDAVYIVSNAFNGRSTSWWTEGSLEIVDLMLERMKQ